MTGLDGYRAQRGGREGRGRRRGRLMRVALDTMETQWGREATQWGREASLEAGLKQGCGSRAGFTCTGWAGVGGGETGSRSLSEILR